jgi:hypothetical protein
MEFHPNQARGRSTAVRSVAGYDGRVHFGAVLGAMAPAFGILALAAMFLFSVH